MAAARPLSRPRKGSALLEVGAVGALIFTKVDRASRCTEYFARLIRLSEEQGWRLIVTEMGIDTCTSMGKARAHLAVVFAELERDFIRVDRDMAESVAGFAWPLRRAAVLVWVPADQEGSRCRRPPS